MLYECVASSLHEDCRSSCCVQGLWGAFGSISHNASARGAEESVVYMKFYNGACKQTRQGKINSTVTQLSKHAHEQQPRIFNNVAIAVLMQQLQLY